MPAQDDATAAAAARWYARLHADDTTDQDRASFARWHDADTRHAAAWRTVEQANALLATGREHPELSAMIAAASAPVPPKRTRWLGYAAAAGALTLGVTATLSVERRREPERASTGLVRASVGGQVRLPDGSRMTLDARSRAVVSMAGAERQVALVAGRGLFEVAKDRARPFVVTAGGMRVTTFGARFNVTVTQGGLVSAALLEGSVLVESPGSTRALTRGDVLTLTGRRLTLERTAAEREGG